MAAVLIGTAWLQRSGDHTVALSPSGPYRIRSTSGPIEVIAGQTAEVNYRTSWLVGEPTASVEANDLVLRCRTWWPCRSATVVELPTETVSEIELSTEDEDLVVSAFNGRLSATTVGDADVILGPVVGSVTAVTGQGSVFGYGLRLSDIEVETVSGAVELGFLDRPARVSVRSGVEPVVITLPPGDYAVSVTSESTIDINVRQVADADAKITINASGPVRIEQAE